MSNLVKHAEKELEILEKVLPDSCVLEFKKEILNLVSAFARSGRGGGGAHYVAYAVTDILYLLMLWEPLTPITGEDSEWVDITEQNEGKPLFQNTRCSELFKDKIDGRAYYVSAIQFKGNISGEFTLNSPIPLSDGRMIKSAMYIKSFHWMPRIYVIDVIDHRFKDSEGTIPDPEGDYWTHTIKDESQLVEVLKYYDIMEEQNDPKTEEQNEEPII